MMIPGTLWGLIVGADDSVRPDKGTTFSLGRTESSAPTKCLTNPMLLHHAAHFSRLMAKKETLLGRLHIRKHTP